LPLPINPNTGGPIPAGTRIVACPNCGTIHPQSLWISAGNKCCAGYCHFEGNPKDAGISWDSPNAWNQPAGIVKLGPIGVSPKTEAPPAKVPLSVETTKGRKNSIAEDLLSIVGVIGLLIIIIYLLIIKNPPLASASPITDYIIAFVNIRLSADPFWSKVIEQVRKPLNISNTPPEVHIKVTNNACDPFDFYIDEIKVLSLDPYGDSGYIIENRGYHTGKACFRDEPTNCSGGDWTFYVDSETTIDPASWCPSSKPSIINLKVINQGCLKNYLYIDGIYKSPIIEPGGSTIIKISYGYHIIQVCNIGNQELCSDKKYSAYYYDTTFTVTRGAFCK